MAWVAIHEEINGPKLRKLVRAIGCEQATAVGLLVFFWQWGLHNADSTGRVMFADLNDLQASVIGKSKYDSKVVIEAMVATGWIDVEEDGTIFIHDWEDWQRFWYQYKERLVRDKERKRKGREMLHTAEREKPVEPAPKTEQVELAETKGKYAPKFEELWEIYPRKKEKAGAYGAYKARLNDGYSHEELQTAVKNYANECAKMHTKPEYIKHAKTFLGPNMPFVDYLPKKGLNGSQKTESDDNPFAEYEVQG